MSDPRGPWSGTAVPPTPSVEPAAEPPRRPEPERAFNAPPAVLAACALIAASFLWQLSAGEEAWLRYALVPIELSASRPVGLLGHIFLHAGWLHLLLNATALLAFGAPVARLFGSDPAGLLRFAAFFLVCGVLGGLTFWALHPEGAMPLVGASGAISGLMGGAARLVERRGIVGRPFSRAALSFVVPWVVLNLLIGLAGAAVALPIAWEAHLGGLLTGLLLLGVFAPRRPLSRLIPGGKGGSSVREREKVAMLVSQILKAKGDQVSTVAPDETVAGAAARLHAERIGALMVMDGEGIAGVISERDIVNALAANGRDALDAPVRECMTAEVIMAAPTETVDVLLARMTDRRVRHLPVVDEGRLCGVVSIGDLVKHKISEVEAEARTLKAYISAG